jgi:hypothetical protein
MDGLMVDLVWVKNPNTGAVTQVPKSAVPQLRQGAWEPLSDKEVADLEKTDAEKLAETEKALQEKAEEGAALLVPSEETEASAGKRPAKSTRKDGE